MIYDGINMVPGQPGTEYFTKTGQIWWGREDQQLWDGGKLSSTAVDSGHSGYTSYLRPGLALGRLASSGELVHWDPFATDGSAALVGFLSWEQQMNYMGTATARFIGSVLIKGNIKASAIVIPGVADPGISGTTLEMELRQQCEGRFNLDDDKGAFGWRNRRPTAAEITANGMTLTRVDHHTRVSNEGATAGFTITLPAPKPGFEIEVFQVAAYDITLQESGTGGYRIGGSNADSDIMDKDFSETIRIVGRRIAADTYKYFMHPVPLANS